MQQGYRVAALACTRPMRPAVYYQPTCSWLRSIVVRSPMHTATPYASQFFMAPP